MVCTQTSFSPPPRSDPPTQNKHQPIGARAFPDTRQKCRVQEGRGPTPPPPPFFFRHAQTSRWCQSKSLGFVAFFVLLRGILHIAPADVDVWFWFCCACLMCMFDVHV